MPHKRTFLHQSGRKYISAAFVCQGYVIPVDDDNERRTRNDVGMFSKSMAEFMLSGLIGSDGSAADELTVARNKTAAIAMRIMIDA